MSDELEDVGSLLGGGDDEDFGPPIRRRSGGFEDASAPNRTRFDNEFDRAFSRIRTRRIPHHLKVAKHQALHDARSALADDPDAYAEIVSLVSRSGVSATGGTRRRADEFELDDLEGLAQDFEDPPRKARPATREDLAARIAEIDAQMERLGAVESGAKSSAGGGSRRRKKPQRVASRESSPVEGDELTSLADLEAALGRKKRKQEHNSSSVERPQATPGEALTELLATPDHYLAEFTAEDLALCECGSPPAPLCVYCSTLFSHGVTPPAGRHREVEMSKKSTKKTGRAYMPKAKSDDHGTPRLIVRALLRMWGRIDLDPCASKKHKTVPAAARYYGPKREHVDGLVADWKGRTFFNPPYGRVLSKWTEKAVLEVTTGDVRACGLLPLRGSTWFLDDVLEQATAVCFVEGRLHFEGNKDSAMFSSIVVLWSDDDFDAFRQAFGRDVDEETGRSVGRVVDLRVIREALAEDREALRELFTKAS